jgi:hypothetical protein
MAVVAASLTARARSSTTSPGMAAGSCCKLVGRCAAERQGRSVRRQGDFPAMARCRGCSRHGLVGRPAGPGSTAPSPDERGGGLAPAQPRPVAEPASRHRHRRALLGHCRPSSSPWPAIAGPAPPPAARCRAPDTAGRCGCRTTGRGCGRPGSASRRSAVYTDGGRPASASTCSGGPCPTPSRARWRSPPAGASSGRSRGVTALGLVARLRPTHQAGGHGQAGAASLIHRTPGRWACRARSGPAGDPKATSDGSCTVACAARAGRARPNKRVVDGPLGAALIRRRPLACDLTGGHTGWPSTEVGGRGGGLGRSGSLCRRGQLLVGLLGGLLDRRVAGRGPGDPARACHFLTRCPARRPDRWGRDRAVNDRNASDNHGQPQRSSSQLSNRVPPSTAGHRGQPIRPDTEGAGGSTPPAPTTPALTRAFAD